MFLGCLYTVDPVEVILDRWLETAEHVGLAFGGPVPILKEKGTCHPQGEKESDGLYSLVLSVVWIFIPPAHPLQGSFNNQVSFDVSLVQDGLDDLLQFVD